MAIYPVVKGQEFDHNNIIPPRASVSELRPHPAGHKDFGGDGSAAQQPPLDSSVGSSAKEGPLIDFHQDMKKDLPSNIKRTDSTESDDEFVDAQG
jgi:hypothetical protein